jgi:hypothetical protein
LSKAKGRKETKIANDNYKNVWELNHDIFLSIVELFTYLILQVHCTVTNTSKHLQEFAPQLKNYSSVDRWIPHFHFQLDESSAHPVPN